MGLGQNDPFQQLVQLQRRRVLVSTARVNIETEGCGGRLGAQSFANRWLGVVQRMVVAIIVPLFHRWFVVIRHHHDGLPFDKYQIIIITVVVWVSIIIVTIGHLHIFHVAQILNHGRHSVQQTGCTSGGGGKWFVLGPRCGRVVQDVGLWGNIKKATVLNNTK